MTGRPAVRLAPGSSLTFERPDVPLVSRARQGSSLSLGGGEGRALFLFSSLVRSGRDATLQASAQG
jgi:hypothetical protein